VNGGQDGEKVVFKVDGVETAETGVWYDSTDQRVDLHLPLSMVVDAISPCARVAVLEICRPSDSTIDRIRVDVAFVPRPPIPDPTGWRIVGQAFELQLANADTGQPIEILTSGYQIHVSFSDAQLAASSVRDASRLGLYYAQGAQWTPAGADTIDLRNSQVRTQLNHASLFALMGPSDGYQVYLPLVDR
jgi:hypothetical protein